jgi:predicted nucleotidyltransferase
LSGKYPMKTKLKTVSKVQLASIARAIVDAANPLKVILFGSQSRGTADEDSDIDLMVIGEKPKDKPWSRRKAVGDIRRSLPASDIPIDILFYTPDEVLRWKETTNHVVRQAFNEGDVLYERS